MNDHVGPSLQLESRKQCRLCLHYEESGIRLALKNLLDFYSLCHGLSNNNAYEWVCQYCWARATQFVKFVEYVRKADRSLHATAMFVDSELKQLHSQVHPFAAIHLEKIIICDAEDCQATLPVHGEEDSLNISFSQTEDCRNDTDYENSLEDDIKEPRSETVGANPKVRKVKKKKRKATEEKEKQALLRFNVELIRYSREEQRREVEMKKLSEKYLKCKHKCEKCGAAYNEEDSYEAHIKKYHHESVGGFECVVCYYRFATEGRLLGHARAHARRYRCLRCARILSSRQQFPAHRSQCSADIETFICRLCDKTYTTSLRLMVHMRRSHAQRDKRFKCDACGKAFLFKCQIRDHIRSHTGVKPFECETCGKKSKTMNLHKIHLMNHAPRQVREDAYCVECDRYFKSPFFLQKHLTSSLLHVTKDVYRHACSECPDRFPVASLLRLHINTVHLKNRTHACALCDKAYFSKGALRIHMTNKHTQRERARDHVCSVCGRAFLVKSSLRQHMVAIHEKGRPYECAVCRATFGYKAALFTHTRLKHKQDSHAVQSSMPVT